MLASDSLDCAYSFPDKDEEITGGIEKTAQQMKVLFVISIIETLAFLIGSFFAKTADMRGRCGEYAVWSMVLTISIGFIAFG